MKTHYRILDFLKVQSASYKHSLGGHQMQFQIKVVLRQTVSKELLQAKAEEMLTRV